MQVDHGDLLTIGGDLAAADRARQAAGPGRVRQVAVTIGQLGDHAVVVTGGDDGIIRLWHLLGDRPVAVSGGSDGTVRLWRVSDDGPALPVRGRRAVQQRPAAAGRRTPAGSTRTR
ncbi:MAG: hypothetical protein WAL41_11705 [Mycobacterium sp.]